MMQRSSLSFAGPEEWVESPTAAESFLFLYPSVGRDERAVYIKGKKRGRPAYDTRPEGEEDRSWVMSVMFRCHAYQDGLSWGCFGFCHNGIRSEVPKSFRKSWDSGFKTAGGTMLLRKEFEKIARAAAYRSFQQGDELSLVVDTILH